MTKYEEYLLRDPYGLILDVNNAGEITKVRIDPDIPAEDRFAHFMDNHTSGQSHENWEKLKAEVDKRKGKVISK